VSEATAVSSEAPAKTKTKRKRYQFPFIVAIFPQIVLFACAVLLLWLSQKDLAGSIRFWEYFVPLVALVSLISGWSQSYLNNEVRAWYLIKQVIHWGALMALIYIMNTQGLRAAIDDQQYTTVVIIMLAFASLLAAIHVDLKLFFFSVFLVFCAYLIAAPGDNALMGYIGDTFGIEGAQDKTLYISIGAAILAFIASAFVLMSMRGALVSKRIGDKRKED
jgi:hypothetical protein